MSKLRFMGNFAFVALYKPPVKKFLLEFAKFEFCEFTLNGF